VTTGQQVRQMVTAQPFRQFTVKLVGGRVFTVKHPENIACSVDDREMTVYDDDGVHLVEMLLVEVIVPVTSPTQTNEGNRS
jgi:hypothetical protein